MRRHVLAPMAVFLLLALLPGSAVALTAGDLDQQSTLVGRSLGATADQAQTFTAGKTGALDDVELYFNGAGTITVTIQATTAGLPNGTILATTTATPTSTAAWLDFAFASPASVTSGVMYAIVFNTGALAAVWGTHVDDPDNYVPGRALYNSSTGWAPSTMRGDFGFRTYVGAAAATASPTVAATASPTVAATASPTSNVTPPPTGTGAPGSSGEPGSLVLLLAGLTAFCGVMLAVLTVRRRSIHRA